jgi:PAS domain S-box-containing protein
MKPWRTADGRIGGAMLFNEVINEQIKARRALADSESRFRATFENAAVGIAHLGPDLRWLRANEALCCILGYPLDELVTKSLQDITHPDDLTADLSEVERMRRNDRQLWHGQALSAQGRSDRLDQADCQLRAQERRVNRLFRQCG